MDIKSRHGFTIITLSVILVAVCAVTSENAYAITSTTETPTDLNATAVSPTQITLTWLPPSQNYGKAIIGYKIEKMVGVGVFDPIMANTGSTFPTYSVTGLKTGTTYTFRVSAVYSDYSTTDPSKWASATPTTTSTQAVSSPSSSPAVNERFDFTPSDGTTLYGVVLTQIDYGQLLTKIESRSIISNSMQTAQSINSDLNNVITYQNNHQISTSVPAPLIAVATSHTQIILSWLAPEQTYGQVITGYKIEWKQASGVYVSIEDNTVSLNTKYTIDGLTTGTTYTYRVSAVFASETISNPSNEASATPLSSLQSTGTQKTLNNASSVSGISPSGSNTTPPKSNATFPVSNAQGPNPSQQINVEFDFTAADGVTLNSVVLTQNEYQQFIVIKDPRGIISNVTMTTSSINNDLSGILRYQNLHNPTVKQEQPANLTQPTPNPPANSDLDNRVLEGVITSVIASGAVGIITWIVKTKVARKIAREYHFTIEKFVQDASTHIRIRNSGQTIEDCIILCDKQVCFWTDTNLDKPRHVLEGSISAVRLPTDYENANPLIVVKSGKKILRKNALDDMSHG
ncbi:MAG: fibronectin type III domain-containing protein [Thaumarchaeota archaeon]|nr:fibronectin type III domain-containing protein [Nitrososphaerota archaeon]